MIVVGSTIAPYKAFSNVIGYGPEENMWLLSAEEMIADAASDGHELTFFCATEVDARGLAPFERLQYRMDELTKRTTVDTWTFALDTGAERTGSDERLAHICTGRNLVVEYATRVGAEYILHLDTDLAVPGDTISRLLDVDWPIVGGDVPSYVLSGRELTVRESCDGWPRAHQAGEPFLFPVETHWNTAGFLLVHRSVFTKLRWRTDPDEGMTDDPCYGADALALGWPTLVRKDVYGHHQPLIPVEDRDHDLNIVR